MAVQRAREGVPGEVVVAWALVYEHSVWDPEEEPSRSARERYEEAAAVVQRFFWPADRPPSQAPHGEQALEPNR